MVFPWLFLWNLEWFWSPLNLWRNSQGKHRWQWLCEGSHSAWQRIVSPQSGRRGVCQPDQSKTGSMLESGNSLERIRMEGVSPQLRTHQRKIPYRTSNCNNPMWALGHWRFWNKSSSGDQDCWPSFEFRLWGHNRSRFVNDWTAPWPYLVRCQNLRLDFALARVWSTAEPSMARHCFHWNPLWMRGM